MSFDRFEQVLVQQDERTGLHAVIVIHDTTLGPALGGVRMHPYPDEAAALDDALHLAKAMTLKSAAAGLKLGGGWSAVIGDPARDKTDDLMRAHGRLIATLGPGRFIPVNDVGTTQADMKLIGGETAPVCDSGDPSPMTALGVLEGIRACLRAVGGDGGNGIGGATGIGPGTGSAAGTSTSTSTGPGGDGDGNLAGVRVAVQGAGNVGSALADLLAAESADLLISDTDPTRATAVATRVGARVVPPADLVTADCDILAPCALGPVVTDTTLPALRCRAIAGGANNVLAAHHHAAALEARGILYAPDFCINAGGLIYLEEQLLGHDEAQARTRVRAVGTRVAEVIAYARHSGVTTTDAATELARARLLA
ncbi:Glu/Leu/Phe/Val family dehydrogenase [Catenulispora pinisilvae]|uniref:Glu/Leu/Phe/Val family dehydrogenase n=1 Tax=Catenulispora pinisilvae TaxID=2705253 RepID=UPI00189256B1|nr:Glu/Leu/Phe/Val dehydrogenase [Catenulispora pinisilvae]